MDIFGIYQAMKGMSHTYFQSARRTGRTVSMVEGLKEGDRVGFADRKEAERVKSMCRERGFEIETVVIDPRQPDKVFERGTAQGRFVLDHSWVEQYYLIAIQQAGEDITYFQQKCSGFGEAHLETRRKAIELAKWDISP